MYDRAARPMDFLMPPAHLPSNPYPPDTVHHALWSQWLQHYLEQPVYGQFFDAELQLRMVTGALRSATAGLVSPAQRQTMHRLLGQLDEIGQLLEASGQHAAAAADEGMDGAGDADPSAVDDRA